MKLSVIIPVYNEENTVEEIVKKVTAVAVDKEIIIVDDGSTDRTKAVLTQLESRGLPLTIQNSCSDVKNELRIFRQSPNKGKGAAIQLGLKHVTGDVVIIQDADLEYEPAEYPGLIKPIEEGKAGVVYGSRFMSGKKVTAAGHYWINKMLTVLTNILYHVKLTDMATCYKVFRTDIIKGLDIHCNRFDADAEITAKTLRKSYHIYEVPVSYRGRWYHQGKKITWKDGLKTVYILFKYAF